jgi:uncharacterized protein YndB with AHSA1/START domain
MPSGVVVVERLIAAPAPRIWETLASPEAMRRWLTLTTWEPWPGGRLEGRWEGPRTRTQISGVVQLAEPERRLSFSWREHKAGEEPWPVETLVSLILKGDSSESSTLLRLEHSGFAQLGAELRRQAELDYREIWIAAGYLRYLEALVLGQI